MFKKTGGIIDVDYELIEPVKARVIEVWDAPQELSVGDIVTIVGVLDDENVLVEHSLGWDLEAYPGKLFLYMGMSSLEVIDV